MKKLLLFLFCSTSVFAQDDLLDMLEKEDAKKTTFTQATFKGTRLINGQTVETLAKQHLNFWISHRFGSVNSGFMDNFLGLDEAKIRLGLEYSLTDKWLIGAGRSTIEKTYDIYSKYKVLAQSNKMPVTVTIYGGMTTNTMPSGYTTSSGNVMRYQNNLQRQSYFGQLLIARKFSDKLSLQLMPTVLHNNKSESIYLDNNLASMGFGGRYKVTNRLSVSAEYYKNIADKEDYEEGAGVAYPYQDSFSVGFDIETGGHVFQLHLTNSRGMTEKHFIGQTLGTWGAGDIFYGFNMARTFSLEPKKK
jgi:lipopolysaccharide assembly outer membrane protein LptD (OstA)